MNRRFFALSLVAALLLTGMPASAQKYQGGLVDKSIALIGNEVIMLSELENEAQLLRARGLTVDRSARCEMLEQMMTSKLFLAQAKLDSLTVNDANVEAALEGRMNEIYSSLGGEKQTEEYFGKPVYKLRAEWRDVLTEQSLIQEMQRNVAQNVPKLTPRDVEQYCRETPQEDLPVISTKYRLRQICLYPDREAAKVKVKEKLLELRERIVNGERFSTLARLYSQDPGSMNRGGELGMAPKNVFWPAFSDAAVALKVGQVSQIVETPDGYHIIQMIAREGDMFNARHILMKPEYTSEDRTRAFSKLDSIRGLIVADSVTFFNAARRFSEDPKTFVNGGLLADENTGSSYFEKDQLKPADYAVIRNMKEGDISEPFESLDNEGRNGNTVYKIIMLDQILPSHVANYKEDYDDLTHAIDMKNAEKEIDKFVVDKQKTTFIVLDPMFEGCEFKHKGWYK